MERFLAHEADGGITLLVAAAIALIRANSPWRERPPALAHSARSEARSLLVERDLHLWINDGVMTALYFVVGLEIRRENIRGDLSELRRGAAAIGGMTSTRDQYRT